MTTETLKKGDKVYLCRFGSWDCHYNVGEVTNKTKTGLVTVTLSGGTVIRLRADGTQQGGVHRRSYRGYQLDSVTFEERKAIIAKENRAKEAARLINDVKAKDVRWNYGAASLLAEVDRLQTLVDAAREACALIDTPEVAK